MLTICLLGPVGAREAGRAIPLGGAKQRILLARLAIAGGRPVQPDVLVEDLWGSRPPADPAHALQAHVSRLRSRLPVDVGLSHGGYLLDGADVTVDATLFQDRSTRGRLQLAEGRPETAAVELRSALDLWHGPALADLPDVTGLRPFAVRLDELRGSVLADRIDADLARGQHASLVAELQGLVESAPEHERTWAQLIRALAGSGRRSEALDACRHARDALLEHQGIDPGEELAELHRAVLNDEVGPPVARGRTTGHATPPDPRPAGAEPEIPLPPEVARRAVGDHTGREEELAALARAWDRRANGPQLVTLTGEPGIGKTRLAAEFAAQCAAQGARVLFGRCEESLSVPYQPFMEMLRSEVATIPSTDLAARLGPDPGRLGDVLPGLSEAVPGRVVPVRAARSADPDLERYRTFDAVAGWLAAASSSAPLLLVVDDLQWADHATLMLLQHLLRSTHDIEACLVATHRDREHDESDPISRLVAPLLRPSETSTRVAMSHLPGAEVAELLTNELAAVGVDAAPSPETAQWVERASGGNPLFVVELARQIAEDEAPGVDRTPPVGVREVVDERVRRLPDGLPALLRSAAVVGRTFDPQVLQAVEELDDEGLDELLTAASYTRLIERTSGQRLEYTFSHDLVRTTLYESIPPVRRSRLHRDVGEALERRHLADLKPHYSELAHHFAAAAEVGEATEAIRYLTLAGTSAANQGAPVVAAKHYGRALDLVDPGADPGQYCDLLTARGQAEFQAGRASYRETLLASARMALDSGDATRLAEAAVLNAREWWTGTPAIDHERLLVLESALSTVDPADLTTRVKLLAARAVEKVRDAAQREEAMTDGWHAVALAREHDDPSLLAYALAEHYAVLYASFADPRECVAITKELVDLARGAGDPARELTAAISHAQATAMVGDIGTSDAFLELAESAAVEMHQPSRLWMVRTWVAMRRALHGDLERAEREVVAAYELGTATGQPDAETWFVGQLFTLRWMAGRLPEILDEVEQHVAAQSQVMPAWRAAHALALAEGGRTEEAAGILDDFVCNDLVDLPQDNLWLHALAYLASACVRIGRPDAAAVLHRKLLPYSGLLVDNGTLDSGPVDLHLGLLAQVAGRAPTDGPDGSVPALQRQAERHLADAVQQCHRIGAPVWLERARAALGTAPGAHAPTVAAPQKP